MASNKEIVENAYASFATGDVPAALGAMADDIQWTEADGFPLAGTYVGPQEVLEGVFMRLGEIGDDFAVVPEQFVADGETVVALGSYGWKHKSSGEPAVVKMVHVWTHERWQSRCLPAARRHPQGSRAQLTLRRTPPVGRPSACTASMAIGRHAA